MSDLTVLRDAMREFTAEREWERYHDPKSLMLALVGEVGELSEIFQWMPSSEAADRAQREPVRQQAADEIADVLLYLVRLSDVLGIDVMSAAVEKIAKNREKHAVGDNI